MRKHDIIDKLEVHNVPGIALLLATEKYAQKIWHNIITAQ